MNNKNSIDINSDLLNEISRSLENIDGWGSVEIFIQDNKVTQITQRNIKKTNHKLCLSI